jgi:Uncharacterized protein conserved in bacteria
MKKSIFLLLFSVCFFSGAFAQSKQESIKELMHIMKSDSMMIKMVDQMMPAMISNMKSKMKDQADAEEKSGKMMIIVKQIITEMSPKIMDQMILMYDKYYTEGEINDIITFYKSPTGQKSINTMPLIMKDMMGNMTSTLIPDMAKEIAAKMAELKKK